MKNTRKILSSLFVLIMLWTISYYVFKTTDVRGTLKSAIIEPYAVPSGDN